MPAQAAQLCACKRLSNGRVNRITAVPPGPPPTCTAPARALVCWSDDASGIATCHANGGLTSGQSTITIMCDHAGGEVATGGGCQTSLVGATVAVSAPHILEGGGAGTPVGWDCSVTAGDARGYAICCK